MLLCVEFFSQWKSKNGGNYTLIVTTNRAEDIELVKRLLSELDIPDSVP